MVNMWKVNMTRWSTCKRSTWQQDEKVHPQVTIAVPDVGEENTGQAHHHLIGEKPRWPNIFTLFNFEESTPFGSFESNVDDPLGFQGPPAQAAVEKEQGSSQIPGLTIHPHPHLYHQNHNKFSSSIFYVLLHCTTHPKKSFYHQLCLIHLHKTTCNTFIVVCRALKRYE